MPDETKYGKPWSTEELDAIVAEYFVMLFAELAKQRYVKARHTAALMERLGRSHRSVEFKFQNISAVLDELGLPWITGYIPKKNYQNAIFDALDRFLSLQGTFLSLAPPAPKIEMYTNSVFVDKPIRSIAGETEPVALRRLIRKFDPVERDRRNRALGKAGENFVFNIEKRRLIECGFSSLAKEVRWVADQDGDGAGYDILSFFESGRERLIEVKTTLGGKRTPFYLTRNEEALSQERSEAWCIYRVHEFARTPKIFELRPPLQDSLCLTPETWKAAFA